MIIIFCYATNIYGQNLVPNPGFENIKDTITNFTKDNFEFDAKVHNWISPTTATPDVITPDFIEKFIVPPPPHSGLNMIGMQSHKDDYIEYVMTDLLQPLLPNRTYYVEFWIRRSYCISPKMNVDQKLNDSYGILFTSENKESSNSKILVGKPQINPPSDLLITYKKWERVSKYFTPREKYDKLYLGQFQLKEGERLKMGYFVIDDIVVKEFKDYSSLDKDARLEVGTIIPLNNIFFKTGTTELKDSKSYDSLKELSDYLNYNQSIRIQINGHTDAVGSNRSNMALSKKRAKFIAQSVIQNGIDKSRIEWKGFGEQIPIADNESEEGKSKNRRVEFEVVK